MSRLLSFNKMIFFILLSFFCMQVHGISFFKRVENSYKPPKVLISHGGGDKYAFAYPLYEALLSDETLSGYQLQVFLDLELMMGNQKKQSDHLRDEIESSDIIVFIISPHFITRKWPLLELKWALESKERHPNKVLIPIYYNLSPDDTRAPDEASQRVAFKGLYDASLERYGEKKWGSKETLGMMDDLKKNEGIAWTGCTHLGDLIKKIVFSVKKNIKDPGVTELFEKAKKEMRRNPSLGKDRLKPKAYFDTKENSWVSEGALLYKIETIENWKDLKNRFYNLPINLFFNELVSVIPDCNDNAALDQWSQSWARALAKGDTFAHKVNFMRRVCKEWIKSVDRVIKRDIIPDESLADSIWNIHEYLLTLPDSDEKKKDVKGKLGALLHPLRIMLKLVLSMDKYNCLLNLESESGVNGKAWILEYDLVNAKYAPYLSHKNDIATINYRYLNLIELFKFTSLKPMLDPVFIE